MFENDYPLLSTPSLTALILHAAEAGPVTLESCCKRLDALFVQAQEQPGLPAEERRARLAGHLRDLEVARLLAAEEDGGWRLTDRGRDALCSHPEGIDWSELVRYPEFAAYLRDTATHPAGMDPRPEVYDEGFTACRAGQPFTDNPYTANTVDHLSWENGWMHAFERSKA